MTKIAKLLHRFDLWFTRNFWIYLTNGRKVEQRRNLYKTLDVNDRKVYEKAKMLFDDNFHC